MQAVKIKPLRLSASLILNLTDTGEDSNKYLMLIRKPHMSFQNSLVFPGGVCQPEDERYSKQFSQFSKITAIRETLQETGILLIPPNSSISNIDQLRLQYTDRKFKQLNQLILHLWEKFTHLIVPIVRFVTPQFPKFSRFDCYFFRPLEGVQRINIGNKSGLQNLKIGVQESSKYYWATPSQYLQMMGTGSVYLPPPQRILLNYLIQSPRQSQEYSVQPFIGQLSEGRFLLPGDRDYDYDLFERLQPKSRTSQQIKKYVKSKQLKKKQNHYRKVIFGEKDLKCHVSQVQNEKTILAILAKQQIKPKL